MKLEQTQAAYDQIAERYARQNALMPAALAEAAERLLQLVGPAPCILDVGCGAGRDMSWLAGRGVQVVGCDISSAMLGHARMVSGGPLLQMDMDRLGFRAELFQGIWCCASLLHLPKLEAPRALSEMRRVLERGGVLFLSVQEGAGEGWDTCSYASVERWFARYSLQEMTGILRLCGFTVLESSRSAGIAGHWLQFFARKEAQLP